MNEGLLAQFADKVFSLVREHGIEAEGFYIALTVSNAYYDRVKVNFSNRPIKGEPDLAIGISVKDIGTIAIERLILRQPERIFIEKRDADNSEEFLRQMAYRIFDLAEEEYQIEIENFRLIIIVSKDVLEVQRIGVKAVQSTSEELTVIDQIYTVGIIDRRQRWNIVFKHIPPSYRA